MFHADFGQLVTRAEDIFVAYVFLLWSGRYTIDEYRAFRSWLAKRREAKTRTLTVVQVFRAVACGNMTPEQGADELMKRAP